MRLGQLARKLGTSTSEIVQFLATRNIPIEDGINTRVEDMLVTVVVGKFAPERLAEFTATVEAREPEVEAATPIEEPVVEVVSEALPELKTEPIVEASAEAEPEKIEVIKAPKIELSGLKVLGKIELPEPKKKEEPKAETADAATPIEPVPSSRPLRQPRERDQRRNQRDTNREPRKNPIAQQREREEQAAKKKREEDLKREKERKTQHYLKNVKVAPPTRAAKIVREDVEELEPIAEPPKTFWGRIKRWLTT